MNEKPFLFASLLLDRPGFRTARQLGKVQASSLLRSLFNGDLVIWRNFPEPLYLVERKGLHELDFVPTSPLRDEAARVEAAQDARLQMATSLIGHATRYSWIILAHGDVIALRNWDHLFEKVEEDVLVSRKTDGELDSGFFAVKSEVYARFIENWNRWQNSQSLGKQKGLLAGVIEAAGLSMKEFERGEVVRPFENGTGILDAMEAAVVHLAGGKPEGKRSWLSPCT